MPQELWKHLNIEHFQRYEVSTFGNVRYLNKKSLVVKKLIPRPNRKGYLRVTLIESKHRKTITVHRLVALTFIPNPYNLPQVNHKDKNKQNNYVGNLEWCTNGYNIRYSQLKPIIQYNVMGEEIKEWEAVSDAAAALSIPTTNICKCCKGVILTINGNIFLYKGEKIKTRLQQMSLRQHKSKYEQQHLNI